MKFSELKGELIEEWLVEIYEKCSINEEDHDTLWENLNREIKKKLDLAFEAGQKAKIGCDDCRKNTIVETGCIVCDAYAEGFKEGQKAKNNYERNCISCQNDIADFCTNCYNLNEKQARADAIRDFLGFEPAEIKVMDKIRPLLNKTVLEEMKEKFIEEGRNMREYCEHQRPARDVICQKKKDHNGKHRAVIFWE